MGFVLGVLAVSYLVLVRCPPYGKARCSCPAMVGVTQCHDNGFSKNVIYKFKPSFGPRR
jgi:hypothetical protein